jgi:hypothetical protein
MKIQILDMDLRKGLFIVGSLTTNERMTVTDYQLVYSLTGINDCINAKLHSTGIFIKNGNGEVTKYNVKNIDAKLKKAIRQYMAEHPDVSAVKRAETNVNKNKPVIRPKITSAQAAKIDTRQEEKEEQLRIYHMGNMYTPSGICKKYKCEDVANFTRLYKLGYPMKMCLGLERFDNTLKVTPRDKMMDAYAKSSGTYSY